MQLRAWTRISIGLVGLGLLLPGYASGQQFLWWSDQGESQKTFGANEPVTIYFGRMMFTRGCPRGFNDFVFPYTDIYVVPAGTVTIGGRLHDVSNPQAIPNTVQGAGDGSFVDELIAVTGPGGHLGPGRYDVVYDECQDGFLDSFDGLFPSAIDVVLGTDVPPLPPSIAALKAEAGRQAEAWRTAYAYYRAFFNVVNLFELVQAILQGRSGPAFITGFLQPFGVYGSAAVHSILQVARGLEGIAADPPDPDFDRLTILGARTAIDPEANDPLATSTAALANAVSTDGTLTEAILGSLERYQGAAEARDGQWALIHARSIRGYAESTADRLSRVTAALTTAREALTLDDQPFDEAAATLEAYRARVESSGFTNEEVRAARRLGLTDQDIEATRQDLVARDFSFTKAGLLDALEDLERGNPDLSSTLEALADDMDTIVADLETDPSSNDRAPVADAGGPYVADEGVPFRVDGRRSSSSTTIDRYDWDLDADGIFGDVNTSSFFVVYSRPFDDLVGLRVTNRAGFADVAYSSVSIANVNRRPVLVSSSPEPRLVLVAAGGFETFQVSASDPDGDSIAIEWFLDGQPKTTGGSFTYRPDASDIGSHSIEALISDSSPIGGSVRTGWAVGVVENSPPVARDDVARTAQYEPTTIDVLANDSDPDGDSLRVLQVSAPAHGRVVIEPDGTLTYHPAVTFKGSDSFTYEVADEFDGVAEGTAVVEEIGCGEHGPVSQPVDRTVEPLVGQRDAELARTVHDASCGTLVPAESLITGQDPAPSSPR